MKVLSNLGYMDIYNGTIGTMLAIFSFIFGQYWFLFFAFLILNIIDWLTGWMKSKVANKENSTKGLVGVLKKLGYWLMILVAFIASAIFVEVGHSLGFDLGITTMLGYFVLASLLVNELRSIIENFVEAGYDVPAILVNGLEVADKLVNKEEN